METVVAYRAFGIFADYDGVAPDTCSFVLVPTEVIAKEVCDRLNESPREYTIAFVEGCESAKSFAYREELTESANRVKMTADEAFVFLTEG